MVPLMMLMASCDTDASANGIKLPWSPAALHFNCHDIRSVMCAIFYTIGLVMPTTVPMLHLILIILIKQMQWHFDNPIGIKWCQGWS